MRVVPVRLGPDGTLVCARDHGAPGEPLADVLRDAGDAEVVFEVRNVPGEPDFDAPACAVAHALVDALRGREGVTVASEDWFSIEVARDAGLRTAFVPPEGVAIDAALAYVTEARHAGCLVPEPGGPRWVAP
ncbi:MAG TPA: hypothetical protein VGX28_09800 [Frankiaceae bacterium]|jgi:hypothetical protein|nr:hypothetical protein [Frankiaceae bacterium]